MKIWPYKVLPTTKDEIMTAIKDDAWQAFRMSLKGESTEEKLRRLDGYRRACSYGQDLIPRVEQVRIDNYINALLRGGQLVCQHTVIKVQR